MEGSFKIKLKTSMNGGSSCVVEKGNSAGEMSANEWRTAFTVCSLCAKHIRSTCCKVVFLGWMTFGMCR